MHQHAAAVAAAAHLCAPASRPKNVRRTPCALPLFFAVAAVGRAPAAAARG
eukprot:SAG31_NODE_10680_length_1110_cov_1.140455_1_plen_50_part_10